MRLVLAMAPDLAAVDAVVDGLREAARPWLGAWGAAGLAAAAAEALVNVVIHAEPPATAPVLILLAAGPGRVRVQIADEGAPGPADLYAAVPDLDAVDPRAERGRGLAIVRRFAASVTWRPGPPANRLVLTFARPPDG